MKYCFGVDIGGTTVKMGLFAENGDIRDKWEIVTKTEDEGKAILPDVAAAISGKMEEHHLTKEDIKGIGVGVPAPVTAEGVVNGSANLGWKYKEAKKELEELTGMKATFGNDANVAALGEMWKGGGAGCKNLVMVTLGTGVGGGVIVGGKIVVGQFGAGGEIGHMCVNYHETKQCGCGSYGCLEQYASATGIVYETKKALKDFKEATTLRDLDEVTAKDIFDVAKEGDEIALGLVDEVGEILGSTLSNIACVTNPEVIVIGGGVSKAGQILIDTIQKHFKESCFHACRDTRFELAQLGNDAGIYGAMQLIIG